MKIISRGFMSALLGLTLLTAAMADEGMWLFTQPPRRPLQDKYGFELSAALGERLQKAAVLVGKSGSGAFVSPTGLVLTNHHVGLEWLQELSENGPDLVRDGFYAATPDKEIVCPGLDLRVVWSVADVTARVHGAIKPDMTLAEAKKARTMACRAIERESRRKTGLVSEVEALYHGGRYHLFRYKTYTDVRLVFAPEQALGQVFDVCFLRAYENGKPATTPQYLSWAPAAPANDDLVLVAGFPGSTNRFRAMGELEEIYGPQFFLNFKTLSRWEVTLTEYAKAGDENARHARTEGFYVNNELSGQWTLLGNLEKLLWLKRSQENARQSLLQAKDKELAAAHRQALGRIASCCANGKALYQSYFFLEKPAAAFNSELYQFARDLVRLTDERAKPVAERLPEFTGADLEDKKRELLTPKTIVKEMEIVKLADALDLFRGLAGPDADLAAKILNGKTPDECARALVEGSRLDDVDVRQELLKGGRAAVSASSDPMLVLVRLIDARARQVRRDYEERVIEPCCQAYATLTKVQEAIGESYPDANGTLRLSFGRVTSVGKSTTSNATVGDLFTHLKKSHQEERLPKRWQDAQGRLDEKTPILFTAGVDLVPGSSGSPVVDRQGRVVGVASFAPAGGYELAYIEGQSGGGAVAARGILAVLDDVYQTAELVKELGGNAPARENVAPVRRGFRPPHVPESTVPPPPLVLPRPAASPGYHDYHWVPWPSDAPAPSLPPPSIQGRD
jgi:hypothetical protein